MGLSDAQAFLDPEIGETEQYITAQNIKDSFAQMYTDMPETANVAVGNLLTANQASGGDALGTTEGFVAHVGGTIAVSTDAYLSSKAILCTGGGVDINGNASSGSLSVIPNNSYTFRVMAKSTTMTRTAYVRAYWFTSTGVNYASKSSDSSAAIALSSDYQRYDLTAVAPPDAAFCSIRFIPNAITSGESLLVDQCGFWAGAGGDWAMPGTPIVNLGTKVTHPNTDDVHVQRWDESLGRWQTVYYDSGWRNVSADVTNATIDSGGSYQIRRINNTVTQRTLIGILPTGTGLASLVYVPQAGWRPSGQTVVGRGRRRSNANDIYDMAIVDGFGVYAPVLPSSSILWSMSYFTDDAIPTSLPGTLVSAAPA